MSDAATREQQNTVESSYTLSSIWNWIVLGERRWQLPCGSEATFRSSLHDFWRNDTHLQIKKVNRRQVRLHNQQFLLQEKLERPSNIPPTFHSHPDRLRNMLWYPVMQVPETLTPVVVYVYYKYIWIYPVLPLDNVVFFLYQSCYLYDFMSSWWRATWGGGRTFCLHKRQSQLLPVLYFSLEASILSDLHQVVKWLLFLMHWYVFPFF